MQVNDLDILAQNAFAKNLSNFLIFFFFFTKIGIL